MIDEETAEISFERLLQNVSTDDELVFAVSCAVAIINSGAVKEIFNAGLMEGKILCDAFDIDERNIESAAISLYYEVNKGQGLAKVKPKDLWDNATGTTRKKWMKRAESALRGSGMYK